MHVIFLLHVSLRIFPTIQTVCIILLIHVLVGLAVLLRIEFVLGIVILLEGAGGWRALVVKFLAQLGIQFRPTTKLLIRLDFGFI